MAAPAGKPGQQKAWDAGEDAKPKEGALAEHPSVRSCDTMAAAQPVPPLVMTPESREMIDLYQRREMIDEHEHKLHEEMQHRIVEKHRWLLPCNSIAADNCARS